MASDHIITVPAKSALHDDLAPLLGRFGEIGIPPNLIDAVKRRIETMAVVELIGFAEDVCSGRTSIDLYRLWVETNPNAPSAFVAWFNLGAKCVKVGERRNGIDAFRQTLALQPDFAPALTSLVQQLEFERLDLAYEQNVSPLEARSGGPFDAGNAANRVITQLDILNLVQMLRPWSMAATTKLRIGNPYDGGYVVPASALDCGSVLSIGIGTDVSFDLVLANRGARIMQFDHTVDRPARTHPNFTFHKRGWGIGDEAPFVSLAAMSAMLPDLAAGKSLLKFDVEGAEYDILGAIDAEQLAPFAVIACEIHHLERLTEPALYDRVRCAVEKLTRRHKPVHLHANNCQPVATVAGVPLPPSLELTLLRQDLDVFRGLSDEPIPGPLDWPNNPFLPDICMNAF